MRAIILKKQDTNEYDQWVTCYTKEFGKLTAVAKSVLKPGSIQGMHLDVLNLVDFELISGRGMPIISAAQVENSYRNLKSSYKSIAAAYFFLETIDKLVFENDSDPILWKFLVETLENLDKNGYDAATFKRRQIKPKLASEFKQLFNFWQILRLVGLTDIHHPICKHLKTSIRIKWFRNILDFPRQR